MILTAEIEEAARQAMNGVDVPNATDVSQFVNVWRHIRYWDEKIVLKGLELLARSDEMERIFGVENTALESR